MELMLRMWKACWRRSACLRSRAHQHRAGNAVRQMRRRCLQANKESTDLLLGNFCGLTELTCVVRWESLIKPWTCERHGHEEHQLDIAIPRGNPGIMTLRPTTLNLEAANRAHVGSVLTYGDSDWAGHADRFRVRGTASWLRGKLGWYPITTSSRKPSTFALSSVDAELVAGLS